MSKFNTPVRPAEPDKVNRAGGVAFKETPKVALVNLLLTSFMKDKFYESATEETARLNELLRAVDPRFAAKAAIYARERFGMRSITHYTAAVLAKNVKGERWTRAFYRGVIRRPDDILEILAAYKAINGGTLHPIPNSLKRGLADKQTTLGFQALAKYAASGKEIKQVDVANLIHPKFSPPLTALVKGKLKSADTWESKISDAGREGTEEEVAVKKAEEWARLINEKKLGYLALIRNIRNILEARLDDATFGNFINQLQDVEAIKKSLVFPFRILVALKVVENLDASSYRTFGDGKGAKADIGYVTSALSVALDRALANVPELPGKTLVALDESGSMTSCAVNSRTFGKTPVEITAAEIGALFAAVLAKKGADLLTFSDYARYRPVNAQDPATTIARSIRFASGGTNFDSIFKTARTGYDRIIILSDMQAWYGDTLGELKTYRKKFSVDSHLYCVNLVSYGDTQFPANRVYELAGFSDKIFDTMKSLETDPKALIAEIEAIELPA
jgi:60 kDa SS-A/Ro ribonucleoprotein